MRFSSPAYMKPFDKKIGKRFSQLIYCLNPVAGARGYDYCKGSTVKRWPCE